MKENEGPIVLRTACGASRRVMIDNALTEWKMPLLPYQKNASIQYYTKDVPEGSWMRLFEFRGNYEYGAYDLKARVFEEVVADKSTDRPITPVTTEEEPSV